MGYWRCLKADSKSSQTMVIQAPVLFWHQNWEGHPAITVTGYNRPQAKRHGTLEGMHALSVNCGLPPETSINYIVM